VTDEHEQKGNGSDDLKTLHEEVAFDTLFARFVVGPVMRQCEASCAGLAELKGSDNSTRTQSALAE
jgi:hypothetical protein